MALPVVFIRMNLESPCLKIAIDKVIVTDLVKNYKERSRQMKIIQNEKDGIVCVTVKGRAETQLTHEFEGAIKQIVEGDNRNLLLDLGALDYLRSSVLRVILNATKEIERKSGKVVLCSLNEHVKEVFEGNCLKDAIAISDTVESGLCTLLKPLKTV